jgi:hypothetical protein
MSALKLDAYVFEKIVIKLPPFPGKKGKHVMMVNLSFSSVLYLNERIPDIAAVRLVVSARPRRQKANQPKVLFDASIVGVFKRLDRTKSFRVLAKKVAAPILYDILLDHTSKIFNHAIITGFHLPPKIDK